MNSIERKQELIVLQIACLQILKDTKLPFEVMKTIEKPSEEEIQAEIDRLANERIQNEYKENRKREYPSIGDQLDALFKAGLFPEEIASQIQAVKDKYPKGN